MIAAGESSTGPFVRTALFFFFVMVCTVHAVAAPLGSISGTITDQGGAVISNVVVAATHIASGALSKATTDATGRYYIPNLDEGAYRLTIEAPGAGPSKANDFTVKAGNSVVANAAIEIAALQQQPAPMPMPMPANQGAPEISPDACQTQSTDPQMLLACIKLLEQRVNDLESSTVLSEPETRVRRIDVYVDQNGSIVEANSPGARRITTYERERVYRRQTINEKIEEALEDAESHSMAVGVDASIVTQFVKQTKGPSDPSDNNAYALANADLFFTAGIAQHTLFFADIVGLSGPPPDLEVPSLTLLNGYSARLIRQNEISLREAWLRTELFGQALSITAGRLDLTNFFDHNAAANDETTQFLSDALVNNPMLGLSTNGPGVSLVFDPKRSVNFKVGLQQSQTDATNLSDSLFALGEVGFVLTPFSLGEGNYRLWFRTDNSSGPHKTAHGLSFDQKLASQVTLFGRFGSAQAEPRRDYFYSGGLQFSNGLGFSPADTWGAGYAHLDLISGEKERLAEVYYNVGLTERLRLSFHAQHVLETQPGSPDRLGFFVSGVRLQASF